MKVSSPNLRVLRSLSPHSALLLSQHTLSVISTTCADMVPDSQVSGLGNHMAKKEAFPSSRQAKETPDLRLNLQWREDATCDITRWQTRGAPWRGTGKLVRVLRQ